MKTSRVYGGRCTELQANFDHESSSWKMLQTSFEWAEPMSLEVLPKSGMTVNGQLFRLDNLEHHTKESAGFVLPTPNAGDSKNNPLTPSRHTGKHQKCLNTVLGRMYLDGQIKTTGITMEEAIGQKLRIHPHFVEWMMGFPIGWLD